MKKNHEVLKSLAVLRFNILMARGNSAKKNLFLRKRKHLVPTSQNTFFDYPVVWKKTIIAAMDDLLPYIAK